MNLKQFNMKTRRKKKILIQKFETRFCWLKICLLENLIIFAIKNMKTRTEWGFLSSKSSPVHKTTENWLHRPQNRSHSPKQIQKWSPVAVSQIISPQEFVGRHPSVWEIELKYNFSNCFDFGNLNFQWKEIFTSDRIFSNFVGKLYSSLKADYIERENSMKRLNGTQLGLLHKANYVESPNLYEFQLSRLFIGIFTVNIFLSMHDDWRRDGNYF